LPQQKGTGATPLTTQDLLFRDAISIPAAEGPAHFDQTQPCDARAELISISDIGVAVTRNLIRPDLERDNFDLLDLVLKNLGVRSITLGHRDIVPSERRH
jgi:hypothetical protein